MNNKYDNDLYIKKYGHNYQEYESLKFFNFPDFETQNFCENIITLKIKVTFIFKIFTLVLTSLLCSLILFILLVLNIVKKNENLIIAVGSIFIVISFLASIYCLWKFVQLKKLIKDIQSYEQSNKVCKSNALNKIYQSYFFSFFNFLFFGIVSSSIMFLYLSKMVTYLSNNYSELNITKKTINEVRSESDSKSLLV